MSSRNNSSIAQLNKLLEKAGDWDKDERYMATNDLCILFQNYASNSNSKEDAQSSSLKFDEHMEQRICAVVLKQLDDKSNDVQSVAVKCLAILLSKVQQTQICEICKKLCSLILTGQGSLRDIYSIGLKTLISDVPSSMGAVVTDIIAGNLLQGICSQDDEIKRECLDIMTELLARFGNLMEEKDHDSIMTSVIQQLLEKEKIRAVICKRAANCLGALAVVASDVLLNHMVNILLEQIELSEKASVSSSAEKELTRALIQTIGIISRTSVGHRLGRHLDRIVPLFLRFCGDPLDNSEDNDATNELKEHCFPGIESFILRCPREITPYLTQILVVSLGYMKYDPNYAYDDDNEDEMMGEDDEMDEDFDEEDNYMGSDDDDGSWKVRKAAVKVVCAIVTARPELVPQLYTTCVDELITRLKEREENVRLDIIHCITCLVEVSNIGESKGSIAPRSNRDLLEGKASSIINGACAHLVGQSIKTKAAVFNLLRSLVVILGPRLDDHCPRLLSCVEKCMTDKNQALKLDALIFFRLFLDHLSPNTTQLAVSKMVPLVISVVKEEWYKLIAEALRVLNSILETVFFKDKMTSDSDIDCSSFSFKIYQSVLPRLEALDIDLEIKECAIVTIGTLFSHAGNYLSGELPRILLILHRRLENETTRIQTLKTLNRMASPDSVHLDLSSFVLSSGKDLAQFLRQSNRSLKQLTLQTLNCLLQSTSRSYRDGLAAVSPWKDPMIFQTIFSEAAYLVADADLHLTSLCIQLFSTIMEEPNAALLAAEPFKQNIYPKLCILARSPLLQGASLYGLVKLFQILVSANLNHMGFEQLFRSLYYVTDSNEDISKQSLSNLAKCVAGICLQFKNGSSLEFTIRAEGFEQFISDLQRLSSAGAMPSNTDESKKQLALLCLGAIGQNKDVASTTELDLKDLVLAYFGNPHSEDTKLAAASALGHLAVGNMDTFLPIVLQNVNPEAVTSVSQYQYLLLTSLKEIITLLANMKVEFQKYLGVILPVLLSQCKATEESVRSMVAECLGVLTAIEAFTSQIIPVLLNLLQQNQEDKLTRRMIANAMRFTLARISNMSDINEAMQHFLPLLDDPDLDVKKAALFMVNTAAHHNPQTIEAHLVEYITPRLVETLKTKLERVVDLGPFKHKVDENLPLRKASLTCVETIVDTLPNVLDVSTIMAVIPMLLVDKDEIKLQAHQILTKVSSQSPGTLVIYIEQYIEPLEKTINKKIKEDAAGPEVERAHELVKSAVRVALCLNKLIDNDVAVISRKYIDFMSRIRKAQHSAAIIKSLDEE